MGEGGDFDDGLTVDDSGEGMSASSEGEREESSAAGEMNLSCGGETSPESSGLPGEAEVASAPAEGTGSVSGHGMSPSEININPNETYAGINQILEVPHTAEYAQENVELLHNQSVAQILDMNGKYMSEADRERVANGVDNIKAIEYEPNSGKTGGYRFSEGKSGITVANINSQQLERSTKHETNHFASKNREIIVPQPDQHGYTVHKTVGTRQASWFHSTRTGENSGYTETGRGMNEGITTMYTNQQLTELNPKSGEAAKREAVYAHATELCEQLEEIVGQDTIKEAYYGGKLDALEEKVNSLAGEKGFESLRECLDRTISDDRAERVAAMKEAQGILAKMHEEGGKSA
ncbi:MAG: hypothetical protein Q4C61_06545 [Lachnospiraceae bacterium]|nr:hypothetical protein [Lachnospiraceae bacterium]